MIRLLLGKLVILLLFKRSSLRFFMLLLVIIYQCRNFLIMNDTFKFSCGL